MTIKIKEDLLYLPVKNNTFFTSVGDIVRIEAASNYSKIFLKNGKAILVAKVLKWFEQELKNCINDTDCLLPASFIRVHRTHLVNKSCITSYVNGNGGFITLLNGETIEVSKRKKTRFLHSYRVAA